MQPKMKNKQTKTHNPDPVLFNTIATLHLWLLSTSNVAGKTEKLNFKFYIMLINLNNHMWLVVTVLGSTDYIFIVAENLLVSSSYPI